MVSKEEFIKYCDSLITDNDIKEYKKKTKSMWTWLIVAWALMLIAVLITTCFRLSTFSIFNCVKIILFFLPTFLIVTVVIIGTTRYSWQSLKDKNVQSILDYMLGTTKYSYHPNEFVSHDLYDTTSFKLDYDKYKGEDLMIINIPNDDNTPSDVNLKISDITLQQKEIDDDGKVYYVTVCKAMLGYVDFPFEFKCNLSLNTRMNGCERVSLESIKFNKHFYVYTDNQVEALCILTPNMMTKLMKFEKQTRAQIVLELRKNGLMVFKINGNLFELKIKGIKKPCGEVFSKIYDDVAILMSLVTEIKNNNRIFNM